MIRERVSTRGVIRPLEPEEKLSAFALPPELIGVVTELAMRRYIDGKIKFDKKFHKRAKKIEKRRTRNLETARKDAIKHMSQLQTHLEDQKHNKDNPQEKSKGGLTSSDSWNWAWALDADEHPPPSSIVSRRDTDEAVRLARIADQSVLLEEHMMTGNNLWSMVVNFLTVTPDKQHHRHHLHSTTEGKGAGEHDHSRSESKREKFRSRFALFAAASKKAGQSSNA